MRLPLLLDTLESYRRKCSPADAAALARLLEQVEPTRFRAPSQLIRLHEALLFFLAYPASEKVRELAGRILDRLPAQVARLAERWALAEPEVSGIGGSSVTAVFSRPIARYLVRRFPRDIRIAWDAWEHPQRLWLALRGAVALFDDDAEVESDVPYREWLEAAGGLPWLVEQADCYDALEVPLRWELGDSPASRTRMRLAVREVFYHREPLIPRRAVSLDDIPGLPLLPVRKLPTAQGQRLIDRARETSAMRYRELHAFTYGDCREVYECDAGRGVVFYLWGAEARHRLPLRASHAVTIWKNGLPVGYFEALSLCERAEAGFNLYYTFREGETAWMYAQLVRLLRQMLGVTCFVLHPYQIGQDNEEALRSGAFWFYRKLGFRPVDAEIGALLEREEGKLQQDPSYRSPRATLRRLVQRPMIYHFPGTGGEAWETFAARRVGLRVAASAERRYGDDRAALRRAAAQALGITEGEMRDDWAALIRAIPRLDAWRAGEKRALARIYRAKYGAGEIAYLRLTQRHARFRAALLELGRPDAPSDGN